MSDDKQQLPLPDYDHLPIGSLESRIRGLDQSGVEALLVYEAKHGNRLPALNVLRRRLEALHGGAKPTGGGGPVTGASPESGSGAARESRVTPQTEGPAHNPPSQGVPTNPSQPRG